MPFPTTRTNLGCPPYNDHLKDGRIVQRTGSGHIDSYLVGTNIGSETALISVSEMNLSQMLEQLR